MLKIVKDVDLIEDIKKYDVILIGTGIKNSKGNGFQRKISVNFKYVYNELDKTKYDDKSKFGNCLVIPSKYENPIFIYCFIDKGRYKSNLYPDSVNYEALESCLKLVKENFGDKRIASTIMGVNKFEGEGDRDRILKLFETIFADTDITLYDYEQIDHNIESNTMLRNKVNEYKSGKITKEEFDKWRINFTWSLVYGIYSKPPEGLNLPKFQYLRRNKDALARYLKDNGIEIH